ncbi:MAG: alpha/beta hydrolase, partial [Pseudolabrys sp.]
MTESKRVLPRRAVLKTAGLGVGAGLLTGVSAPAQAAPDTEIWSAEYWTKKGDVPLYIFRKRLGAPKPGESSRPVLFLVHGSSVTWRIFDLDTPGHGEYSMMNVFARWGFDVWTMDHENYGKSGRTGGNSDI